MKLYEIIQPTLTTKNVNVNKAQFSQAMDKLGYKNPRDVGLDGKPKHVSSPSKNIEPLGQGKYSSAFQRKNSHEITKVNRGTQDLQRDAYFQFISKLASANSPMAENPYFPRIYNIKVYNNKNKDGPKYFYFVDMEKLVPLQDLTNQELGAILDKALGTNNPVKVATKASKEGLIELLWTSIHESATGQSASKIQDVELVKALGLIRRIPGGMFDLHMYNMMVRRTSVGPQLVLMDPIRDSDLNNQWTG